MHNFITDRRRFHCAICRVCAAFVKCTKYNKRSQNAKIDTMSDENAELSCYCAHWKALYVAITRVVRLLRQCVIRTKGHIIQHSNVITGIVTILHSVFSLSRASPHYSDCK